MTTSMFGVDTVFVLITFGALSVLVLLYLAIRQLDLVIMMVTVIGTPAAAVLEWVWGADTKIIITTIVAGIVLFAVTALTGGGAHARRRRKIEP